MDSRHGTGNGGTQRSQPPGDAKASQQDWQRACEVLESQLIEKPHLSRKSNTSQDLGLASGPPAMELDGTRWIAGSHQRPPSLTQPETKKEMKSNSQSGMTNIHLTAIWLLSY